MPSSASASPSPSSSARGGSGGGGGGGGDGGTDGGGGGAWGCQNGMAGGKAGGGGEGGGGGDGGGGEGGGGGSASHAESMYSPTLTPPPLSASLARSSGSKAAWLPLLESQEWRTVPHSAAACTNGPPGCCHEERSHTGAGSHISPGPSLKMTTQHRVPSRQPSGPNAAIGGGDGDGGGGDGDGWPTDASGSGGGAGGAAPTSSRWHSSQSAASCQNGTAADCALAEASAQLTHCSPKRHGGGGGAAPAP